MNFGGVAALRAVSSALCLATASSALCLCAAVLSLTAAALSPTAAAQPSVIPARARSMAKNAPVRVSVIQTTADLTQHMARLGHLELTRARPHGLPVIQIDDRVSYQRVRAFGAALTDTSAWLIQDELSRSERAALIGDLFGRRSIGLRFLRLPMGASDFTRNGLPYSYDDLPPGKSDPRLRRFSIAHDRAYVIPTLKEALRRNPQLEILASPWSPPAWMKANHSLANRDGRAYLLGWAYRPLARYFVRFLEAYRRAGVPIAAITPQNEPGTVTSYPGSAFAAPSEASWVARYLVPALRAAKLNPAIYGNEHGWNPLGSTYAERLVSGPAVRLLAGLAWHCYFGSPYAMSVLHSLAPHLDQIVDECSPGITPFPVAEALISSVRNWATAVALWNLALDPRGGPVEAPNGGCGGCTGVATVSEETHHFTLGLTYYQLGQVSAFVKPGARHIASTHFVSYVYSGPARNFIPGLDDVAFQNPDGSEVLVAYDNAAAAASFAVHWSGRWFTYTLPAGAMVTFVRRRPKTARATRARSLPCNRRNASRPPLASGRLRAARGRAGRSGDGGRVRAGSARVSARRGRG